MRFALATSDGPLSALSVPLLALPGVMFVLAAWNPSQTDLLGVLGSLFVIMYVTVWLFLRPNQLEVTSDQLLLDFPLRSVEVARSTIRHVELHEGDSFARSVAARLLLRAAGIWGGAGWLRQEGIGYEVYACRTRDLVAVHRDGHPPLLLSLEDPQAFVAALRHEPSTSRPPAVAAG